jgi:hypothetical protein
MPQIESRAQSLVALKVFHCVWWTVTGNCISFKLVTQVVIKIVVLKETKSFSEHCRYYIIVVMGRVRKITKRLLSSSCLSVSLSFCPSVRMEQLGSHWTDFHEI